jgi:hypothetical protein
MNLILLHILTILKALFTVDVCILRGRPCPSQSSPAGIAEACPVSLACRETITQLKLIRDLSRHKTATQLVRLPFSWVGAS